MSDGPAGLPPERVRVTGPARRRTPRARASEIDAETRLGAVFISALLREQLRLALGILLALALTVGLLPVVFVLFPDLASLHVLGMPVTWLVLGTLVYPMLVLLGWIYIRRAERNERDFAELLSEVGPAGPEGREDAGP